jgi:SAM-dependent methyltransferase
MTTIRFSGPPSSLKGRIQYLIGGPNRKRAGEIAARVLPHLRAGEHVLDIGAGRALVADAIMNAGHPTSIVDVVNLSLVEHLQPKIYDGNTLPYPDNVFDVALLLTVLHHIPNPDNTLREARRVAKRVIVMEDIFNSPREKAITQFGDSWLNWEWRGHPHSNRNDAGWRAAFSKLGLRVAHYDESLDWFFPFRFRHALYVLERE